MDLIIFFILIPIIIVILIILTLKYYKSRVEKLIDLNEISPNKLIKIFKSKNIPDFFNDRELYCKEIYGRIIEEKIITIRNTLEKLR
ncbi:MAG: hypothetical protein ACTSYR_01580 [Candidatus Odinarchaeia archaeon]